MATPVRVALKRKWGQAIGNIETAQTYVTEIATYYKEHHPDYVTMTEVMFEMLEQARLFLIDCRSKT